MDNEIKLSNIRKKEIECKNIGKENNVKSKKNNLGLFKKFFNFLGISQSKNETSCKIDQNENIDQKANNKINCVSKNESEQKEENLEETMIGKEFEKTMLLDTKNTSNKKDGFFTKFLKIKHVKTAIIVLIFAVSALLILNSSFGTSFINTKTESNSNYMTCLEYCEKLENKLTEVLGKISGVGDVDVMITAESGPEIKIATSTDEKTNTTTSGSNSTSNSTTITDPIIITSSGLNSPIVLTEMAPKITGVIVVASGAKDVKVKLYLIDAIKALLDVSSNNIQIYY